MDRVLYLSREEMLKDVERRAHSGWLVDRIVARADDSYEVEFVRHQPVGLSAQVQPASK